MSNIEDIINSVGRRQAAAPEERASLRLRRAWVAERTAPVLLPFEEHTLDEVMQQIRRLAETIEETSLSLQAEGTHDKNVKLQLLVVEAELERLKFLARGYLRARIAKIDQNLVFYRLHGEENGLSASEQRYVEQHLVLRHRLYFASFMHQWPEELHDLADTAGPVSMVDKPDSEKPVAIRVLRDVPELLTVGDDTIELKKGGIYMLRYSAVAPLAAPQSDPPAVELV